MNYFAIRADGYLSKDTVEFHNIDMDAELDIISEDIDAVKFTNGGAFGNGEITYANGSKEIFNDPNKFSALLALHADLVANPPDSVLAPIAREKREKLLLESDWTQLSDTALIAAKVTEWATYRQALRDVPQQGSFPGTITWPTEPAA